MTEGSVVVPREPTEAMLVNGREALMPIIRLASYGPLIGLWKDMIAAAPPLEGSEGLGSSLRDTQPDSADGAGQWRAPRWPTKGTLLRFLGKNGYDHELSAALKVLTPDQIYTCIDCSVGDWENSVSLEGVAGRFNGVMFEMASPDAALPTAQADAGGGE